MKQRDFSGLRAVFINGTLKRSPEISHTQGLMEVSGRIMNKEGVDTEFIRFVDHDVAPGIYPDMTEHGWEKDEWPELFKRIMAADILIIGTPIWLGEKSSETTKLIERLYSHSAELNDKGQYIYYGKTGGCVITGNEDGVKHCARDILYALQHIGFSIPPQADCGWVGEAGPGPSYLDDESNAFKNDFTNRNTTFMTYNLMHMALILRDIRGFPAYGNLPEDWKSGTRWNFENPEHRN